MRLNYDTFTGRRSVFVGVAAALILLSWGAFAVLGPEIAKHLSQQHVGKNMINAVMLLIQNGLVVFSVLIAGLVAERDRSMKEKFGLAVDPGYSLQYLFPVFVLALLATYGSQYGLSHLLKAFGREPKPQTVVEMFRAMKPLTFLGFAAITVIATPIAEELAFRHILYRLFRMFLYRRESAVVVSLIFALCHAPLATMFQTKPFPWEMLVLPVIPLFILAMFFQWQYEKSKSIVPSMLMHAGFNLISVILVALQVAYGKPEEAPANPSDSGEPAIKMSDKLTVEPTVEAPAETSVETPAEAPAEAPVEAPATNNGSAPASVPATNNGSAPASVPASNDSSAPAAVPASNDSSAPMAVPVAVPVEAIFFLGF